MAEKINLKDVMGSIALGTFLSDWDQKKSYEDIMEILNREETWSDIDPDIINVWEKFEQNSPSYVADHISVLYEDLNNLLTTTLTEIKNEKSKVEDLLKTLKGI